MVLKFILVFFMIAAEIAFLGAGQPSVNVSVNVAPMDKVGPRPVEAQTRTSVIRDYLQAWQGLSGALDRNDADSLDQYQWRRQAKPRGNDSRTGKS